MLHFLQTGTLLAGVLLVALAIITYLRRTHHWNALWRVWIGQLKDLNLTEFRLYRSGILLLFAGVLLRIVNLTLNG